MSPKKSSDKGFKKRKSNKMRKKCERKLRVRHTLKLPIEIQRSTAVKSETVWLGKYNQQGAFNCNY